MEHPARDGCGRSAHRRRRLGSGRMGYRTPGRDPVRAGTPGLLMRPARDCGSSNWSMVPRRPLSPLGKERRQIRRISIETNILEGGRERLPELMRQAHARWLERQAWDSSW
jgi:hypothetical protein